MSECLGQCPLCGREMVEGPSVNLHHVVPKSLGGREVFWVHTVCHSKIHSLFTNRELFHFYNTFEKLREHPDVQSFVKWIKRKPLEFRTRNKKSRRIRR